MKASVEILLLEGPQATSLDKSPERCSRWRNATKRIGAKHTQSSTRLSVTLLPSEWKDLWIKRTEFLLKNAMFVEGKALSQCGTQDRNINLRAGERERENM